MKSIKYQLLICFLLSSAYANAQDLLTYTSANLAKVDSVWVFKPTNSRKEKLPMIFLLHGYSGNYKQWHSIMDGQAYADKYGFIIVCPDGLFNSWYLNSPVKANWQYEQFFFDELWPDVMKRYTPDAGKIFISGLSMGGHGALSLFISHPEKFKSAGSTSGATNLSTLGKRYGIDTVLAKGQPDAGTLLSYSVEGRIQALKGSDKHIIFDCGTEDGFNTMNNDLKLTLDKLKIKATYISQPGAHNRAYWAKSIRQHFEFFSAMLK